MGLESIIADGWGLDRGTLDGLRQKSKSCRVYIPNSWAPPPCLVFKLTFDGAVKGNPRAAGYSGTRGYASGSQSRAQVRLAPDNGGRGLEYPHSDG